MNAEQLRQRFEDAQVMVGKLHRELNETNSGLRGLTQEFELRVKSLTEQLHAAHAELERTNTELMQLTLELEDRVAQRTAEVATAHGELQRTNTELMQLTLELEDRVAERTSQLQTAHDQLEQRVLERTAELRAANEEMEAFAYAVSHDLRAPVRAMGGFNRALKEDYGSALPAGGREYLTEIDTACRQMGGLIDGLLALSRCTRSELNREETDISAMADRILARLAQADGPRKIVWRVQPGLTARCDGRMIEAALTNLLDNAWKYTRKTEQAMIEVGALDRAPATGSNGSAGARFFVRDNGAGFDRRHAARLFRPFQRMHRQDEFPGMGIGLATVQRIIHRHGGVIEAAGEPGKGATFFFTLGIGQEPVHPS